MNWIDSEEGPECLCGMPTCVKLSEGKAYLMCIFHTWEAGAMFSLPKDGKPENWPNLSNDELKELIVKAEEE